MRSLTASRSVIRFSLDLRAAEGGLRDRGDELLQALGLVDVVRVGLVPLEHRELGIVLGRDALVAEVLAELVHAIDPTHDESLQIELGGDPEVEIAVERVVMGRERPRERAAVERLEDRRLDLDEAARVEPLADRGDDLRALGEQLANLRVGDQVELAVAVAHLHVLEPVELVGWWAQALRQQCPGLDTQRELAALGREHDSLGADDVAEVHAH